MTTTAAPPRTAIAVVLCWLFIVFDGYDLIVYGTVVPGIGREWGIGKSAAGLIGSLAFLGMIAGALAGGRLADSLGRKRVIQGCVATFSVATVACAFATGPAAFGVLRFVAGLGLGGIVVSANTLMTDITSPRHRPLVATVLMSGVPMGGSIAALIGIEIIPSLGWRWMFAPAAIPLVFLLPLAIRYLPAHTTPRPRDAATASGYLAILRKPLLPLSVLFGLSVATTFITWYGLGTWLPGIMAQAGYDLGSALTFALALNLGAVAGSSVIAWAGSRFGAIRVAAFAIGVSGVSLVAMSLGNPGTVGLYALVVAAGMGAHGAACLVTGAVAGYYPDDLRGSGLGWAIGTGRVGAVIAPSIAGWLLSTGLPAPASLVFFAVSALVAAAVYLVLARRY
ncbi:MFS transporter [Amycolatopsis sp. cg5]|uniref:MFS transporter n=1 Tax=Amycolatopsis sp. cg5 TaxID=3238802 RepID=UPI0035253E43